MRRGCATALASYVAHARRGRGGRVSATGRRGRPARGDREQTQAIRPGRARTGTRSARRAESRPPSWRPITPSSDPCGCVDGTFPLSAADGLAIPTPGGAELSAPAPPGAVITSRATGSLRGEVGRSPATLAGLMAAPEDDDELLLNGDPPMQRLRAELRLRPALVAVAVELAFVLVLGNQWMFDHVVEPWSISTSGVRRGAGPVDRLVQLAARAHSTGSPGCGWAGCCTRWSGCWRPIGWFACRCAPTDPAARFLSVVGSVLIAADPGAARHPAGELPRRVAAVRVGGRTW